MPTLGAFTLLCMEFYNNLEHFFFNIQDNMTNYAYYYESNIYYRILTKTFHNNLMDFVKNNSNSENLQKHTNILTLFILFLYFFHTKKTKTKTKKNRKSCYLNRKHTNIHT